MLGLHFCARAFSSCGKRGPLFIAVRGPLTIAASPVAEHKLQTRRLSSCGSRAQPLRGMWDPPRPGLEPVSPALAGRLSTAAPPGKPQNDNNLITYVNYPIRLTADLLLCVSFYQKCFHIPSLFFKNLNLVFLCHVFVYFCFSPYLSFPS